MASIPSSPSPRKGILPRSVREFMHTESASGIVMMVFAALAILLANSPLGHDYKQFVNTPVIFGWDGRFAAEPLKNWIKDILMVFFFLIIGLELKREACEGFLSNRDQILLPLVAAIGGMIVPAAFFLLFNYSHPDMLRGWAIPSATDIAFALAVLLLLGKGIPPSIKIFLLALAIFDDLGAILVIAFFYSGGLALTPLALAAALLMAMFALNRSNVTSLTPYMMLGVALWFAFYHSGVHTTLAGVLVALAIPMRDTQDPRHSPINACMHFLHPWVSFLVLPIFAFTSAGLDIRHLTPSSFLEPLPLGIAAGLFVGKQIGIFATTYALVKSGFVRMPQDARWGHIYAVSVIAGIGFTMSLFIGMLAFSDPHAQELVKVGVISGSLLSVLWGGVVLKIVTRRA